MVRELLGNIKGPRGFQGVKGDKGDNGDITQVDVSVVNHIDLNKLKPRVTSTNIDIDLDNGVINYSNGSNDLFYFKTLEIGDYYFSVKDYTVHEGYGGLRFRATDAENNDLINTNYTGETLSITISESTPQPVQLRVYVSNTIYSASGFVEKPMLVKSEYNVEWFPSYSDLEVILNNQKPFYDVRLFERNLLPNEEFSLAVLNRGSSSVPTDTNGNLILTKGTWLVTWSSSITMTGSDTVTTRIKKDGNDIFRETSTDFYRNISVIIDVENEHSVIDFTIINNGDTTVTMSTDIRNSTQIKKL